MFPRDAVLTCADWGPLWALQAAAEEGGTEMFAGGGFVRAGDEF